MTTKRIFVSHSHQDDAFCRELVQALRDHGADVWYDEHNMGSGNLMDVVQQELEQRPIFIVILSKSAFGSFWVRDECLWAYALYRRESGRMILPVMAQPIDATDFSGANGWLFLEPFKRIEAAGLKPFPIAEATKRTLQVIEQGAAMPGSSSVTGSATTRASTTASSAAAPSGPDITWQRLITQQLVSGKISDANTTALKVIEGGQANFDWSDILIGFYKASWSSSASILRDKLLVAKVPGTNWQHLIMQQLDNQKISDANTTALKVIEYKHAEFDWTDILTGFFMAGWSSSAGILRDRLLAAKIAGTDWQRLIMQQLANGKTSDANTTALKVIEGGQANFDWTDILAGFYKAGWSSSANILRDKLLKAK